DNQIVHTLEQYQPPFDQHPQPLFFLFSRLYLPLFRSIVLQILFLKFSIASIKGIYWFFFIYLNVFLFFWNFYENSISLTTAITNRCNAQDSATTLYLIT